MSVTNLDKVLQNMIRKAETKQDLEDIKAFAAKNKDEMLTPTSLGMLFEVICSSYFNKNYLKNETDDTYFTGVVDIESQLVPYNLHFRSTNGCQWARSDSSYLGKKYIIKRHHMSNRVAGIQLDGSNSKSTKSSGIHPDILKAINVQKCVILDTNANIEVDHKDGFKDDWRLTDLNKQKLTDFQPLCKTANNVKKEKCKRCRQTGKRYDARVLGYSVGWVFGDADTKNCVGCYWYDPKQFNQEVSKDYRKEVKEKI